MIKSGAIRGGLMTLALIPCLAAGTAMGASSTTATTTATAQPSLLEKIGISYWGKFHGPGVTQVGSFQTDEEGYIDEKSPLLVENTLGISYKFTSELTLGVTEGLNFQPVLNHDTTFSDPWIWIKKDNVINAGGLTLTVDGRVYVPVTDKSRNREQIMALRSTQILNYAIAGSRWSVGTFSLFKGYFLLAASEKDHDWEAYFSPNINYQISPKVVAGASVGLLDLAHEAGKPSNQVNMATLDTSMGLTFEVMKGLSVNPYLNFYPTKPSIYSTKFQMEISAKLL